MKYFLVILAIICMVIFVGAQETVAPETKVVEPVSKPVTHLNVTIIDGMNNTLIELKNCMVNVIGELHLCDDSFTYSNTFNDGYTYDITIWVKSKK